jgi:ketosteroid isomerase-like protein
MKILTGATIMALTLFSDPHAAQAETPDQAAVKTVVESVATFADSGRFDELEALYAEEVRVDYSALTGAPAEVKSGRALITEWAGLLPGFDRTRHALANVSASVSGDTASASADVVASHWIGDGFWQVSGRYDYRLARDGRQWRIAAHSLTVTGEKGSRDVFAGAAAAAKRNPPDYILRTQTRQAVLDFLTGLERKDMAQVNAIWAEDAVQEMQYVPEGFPSRVVGRDALIRQYAAWPKISGRARFTDGIRFYPARDPRIVFVEYHGVTEVVPTKRVYDQRYGGLFHVENGKITLFREYFDPNVFAKAFALGEGGTFFKD